METIPCQVQQWNLPVVAIMFLVAFLFAGAALVYYKRIKFYHKNNFKTRYDKLYTHYQKMEEVYQRRISELISEINRYKQRENSVHQKQFKQTKPRHKIKPKNLE